MMLCWLFSCFFVWKKTDKKKKNVFLNLFIYFNFPFLNFIPEEFCSLTDLEKLSTFSQRFPLPSMYRIHVWKVLLGKNHM